jgi:hypothetical protein
MLGSELLDPSDVLSDHVESLVRLTRSGEKNVLSNYKAPTASGDSGWYVDPTEFFHERFWSGSEWSSAVRLIDGPPMLWPFSSPPSTEALELIKRKTLTAPQVLSDQSLSSRGLNRMRQRQAGLSDVPSTSTAVVASTVDAQKVPAMDAWREAALRLLPSSTANHLRHDPIKTGRELLRLAWAVCSTDSDAVRTRDLLDVSTAAFSAAASTGSLEAQMWTGIVTVLRGTQSSQGLEMLEGASVAFEKRGNFKMAARGAEELAEGARLAHDQSRSQEHFRRAAELFERAGESGRAAQARMNSAPGKVRTHNPLFSGGQPSMTATTILGSGEALALFTRGSDSGRY